MVGAGGTARRITAAAVAVGLAMAVGCAATTGEQEHRMPESAASAAAQLPAATDGAEKLSGGELDPVYWLQSGSEGVYLYREYVRAEATGDPVTDAVTHLLNQPAGTEGWFTYLKPASEIGVSLSADNVITLDLPRRVFAARLDDGLAERSVQQLVFTATAAAANAGLLTGASAPKVRILVDGSANATVFDGYRLQPDYQRDPALMAPIWIIDPQNRARPGGPNVKLNARSIPFTDGTHYSLDMRGQDGDWISIGEPVRIDSSERAADGSFTRELQLPQGAYRLTMWGQNSGSAEKIAEVSSLFTVK